MRSIKQVGLVSLTGLMLSALPLAAQRVSADIVLVQGPVAARIQVNPRREVVYAPWVIEVRRRHTPRGRARGWWRNEGYQRAIVWVDVEGRYYDRDYRRDDDRDNDRGRDRDYDRGRGRGHDRDRGYDRGRDDDRGLRPVTVYERDGQYYDWDD